MIWNEDEILVPQRHNRAGRPEVNPFPSDEVEEDFCMRGRKMIELYYVPDPKSKNNFVFNEKYHMSKTLFWSIIFIYYADKKGLQDNLQGFLSEAKKHLGGEYLCDRSSILKRVKALNSFFVTHKHTTNSYLSPIDQRVHQEYRSQYQYVIKRWEECVLA